MGRFSFKSYLIKLLGLLLGSLFLLLQATTAQAAASMYLSASGSVQVGDILSVTVNVNTGGQAANSYDAMFSYPASLFDPVSGSTSGSVCSIWINTPDPSSNPGEIQCGSSNALTGTGLIGTYKIKAKAPGSGSLGLSGCQVLAADGKGTPITGGCSGSSITVAAAATPIPTAEPTPVPTAAPTAAPVVATTTAQQSQVKSTPKPNVQQATKPAEQPSTPTPAPTSPPPPSAQPLATPGKTAGSGQPVATNQPSNQPDNSPSQKRSFGKAFQDLIQSFKDFQKSPHDVPGLAAIILSLIPFLALCLAIVYFIYRLYLLERRRKRTLDRLFEMELSELAALEGKLDLLAEKGSKGREQYREEFKLAKEHILRELHPDYGQPIDGSRKAKKEDSPATPSPAAN